MALVESLAHPIVVLSAALTYTVVSWSRVGGCQGFTAYSNFLFPDRTNVHHQKWAGLSAPLNSEYFSRWSNRFVNARLGLKGCQWPRRRDLRVWVEEEEEMKKKRTLRRWEWVNYIRRGRRPSRTFAGTSRRLILLIYQSAIFFVLLFVFSPRVKKGVSEDFALSRLDWLRCNHHLMNPLCSSVPGKVADEECVFALL